MRYFQVLTALACVLTCLLPVYGQERFPRPEFEGDYVIPETTQPSARTEGLEYLDVAVLAAALGLAAYLALKQRKRRWIFLLAVFSLIYFGFWREGCVCAVGSVQNIALGIASSGYAVPVTVIVFFMLPLLFALFFGRVFCAAVCPLGAAQDVVLLKPVKVPTWLAHFLSVIPYAYLGLAVLMAALGADFLICRYDPFVGFFRMGATFGMLLLGAAFLVVGTVVGRPYCRFFCPYGVLLNWTSRLSKHHLQTTPADCIQCRLCEHTCPFDALKRPSPERDPEPRGVAAKRLGWIFLLLPLIVGAGIGAGLLVHHSLSRIHPTVSLAERVMLERSGKVEGTTEESKAFAASERTIENLFAETETLRGRCRTGSALLGAFLGLVIWGKLLALSVRRRRKDFEPERGTCYSCGRCISSCPVRGKEAVDG
jgi:ferredoxin